MILLDIQIELKHEYELVDMLAWYFILIIRISIIKGESLKATKYLLSELVFLLHYPSK